MKKYNFAVLFCLLLSFILMYRICYAQEWSRKGKGEIFGLGEYLNGDTTSGLGLTIELDSAFAGGIGGGYNFNDYINLNTDLLFSSMDITAEGYGEKLVSDTTVFIWDLNLDINFLKKRFSPLITGGIGLVTFSGDWGSDFDFNETDFSYNVGGGFRWNITDHFLVKAIYRATWTKLEDADNSLLLDGIAVSIGYTF